MADVWFARDTGAAAGGAGAATAATPALHDLLAAPSIDLLPAAASAGATRSHDGAVATPHTRFAETVHGLGDHRLIGDEDPARHASLL